MTAEHPAGRRCRGTHRAAHRASGRNGTRAAAALTLTVALGAVGTAGADAFRPATGTAVSRIGQELTTAVARTVTGTVAGNAAGGAGPSTVQAAAGLQRAGSAAQRSTRRATPPAVAVAGLADGVQGARGDVAQALTAHQQSLDATLETSRASRDQVGEIHRRAVHQPILEGRRTSTFGWRWGRMHNGMDVAADHGTPLYAVGRGTVTTTGYNPGLGYHVKITLEDDTVVVYGHLSRIGAERGDAVEAGTVVGEVGSSGRSTGAHLHFEVRVDGEPIDPGPWLDARS